MEVEKIFVTVKEAVRYTGLSEHYIRGELRSGKIPCLKVGKKYMINLPLYLREISAEGSDVS